MEEEEIIVLVKLDKTTYTKVEDLIRRGSYGSIGSFVEIAVRNQLLLETGGDLETLKRRSVRKPAKAKRPLPSTILSIPKKNFAQTVMTQSIDDSIKHASIWGQINRLAPAKFVLRALLNSLSSIGEKNVDLKLFSAEVAEQATAFRRFAKRKDKKRRVRGEEIYVGFPKKSPASQQRFLNYYVGKKALRKWTDSVLTGLCLANIEEMEDGATVIGITEEGLKLALLHSPLVDDFFLDEKQIDNPLSDDEVHFLIEHIKVTRPGEHEFLLFVLDSIKRGANNPTELQGRVFDFLRGKDLKITLSEKVANTMQVGAIGRLVEMRLLKIEKEAQRSRYVVTGKGERTIE